MSIHWINGRPATDADWIRECFLEETEGERTPAQPARIVDLDDGRFEIAGVVIVDSKELAEELVNAA